MFSSDDPHVLADVLNTFQIPMFLAEIDDTDEVRVIGINDCHGAASQLDPEQARGARLGDLLSSEEAAVVRERYLGCLRLGAPCEYDEVLTIQGVEAHWHTVLVPTRSASGRARVIGNAMLLREGQRPAQPMRLYDDIDYYAIQSQFQVSRIAAYLDAMTAGRRTQILASDIEALLGLCRTADYTLNDIRSLIRPLRSRRAPARQGGMQAAMRLVRDPVRKTLSDLSHLLTAQH